MTSSLRLVLGHCCPSRSTASAAPTYRKLLDKQILPAFEQATLGGSTR